MFEPPSPALPPAERSAALAFSCVPGLTRRRIELLRRAFGSLSEALDASLEALLAAGIPEAAARQIALGEARRLGDAAESRSRAIGARILVAGDPTWPVAFDRVPSPPMLVFVVGRPLSTPSAAVVGARRCDAYGLEVARRLGLELSQAGVQLVSGGALGVDGAAHAGALAAGGAGTVAVLGCGLDVRYPPEHARLLDRIAAEGALLSELPPGKEPLAHHFPKRNRLIAALSEAVVVVRAAPRSGALETARQGERLGRPLLAVPGPAGDPLSAGTLGLLRRGALLCEGAKDVLAALGRSVQEPLALPTAAVDDAGLPPSASQRLLELLGAVPASVDELGSLSGMAPAELASALALLELEGLAKRAPGNFYERAPGI
ncbi:MAG: DNA-processing protein DprA [Deltaproteobacteria bacterium]